MRVEFLDGIRGLFYRQNPISKTTSPDAIVTMAATAIRPLAPRLMIAYIDQDVSKRLLHQLQFSRKPLFEQKCALRRETRSTNEGSKGARIL
jgi:hypothetical protein